MSEQLDFDEDLAQRRSALAELKAEIDRRRIETAGKALLLSLRWDLAMKIVAAPIQGGSSSERLQIFNQLNDNSVRFVITRDTAAHEITLRWNTDGIVLYAGRQMLNVFPTSYEHRLVVLNGPTVEDFVNLSMQNLGYSTVESEL